ncbi:outer membrane protein TolC [Balneicella halophila]|uniref:Outer membrane protein TolC n=1 Tax=Balneicella halophila TaxID=1537566 RepID=A0A7L4UQA9_BALHA|nr:TolC family protein [Balneicella halophila]PVX51940.1 outer membrane protein TolC [Balneicella halophila]
MKRYITIILILFCIKGFSQTLDDYFVIAAENNPGLQAKYKEYEASLQKISQVNTLQDPTFSFGYFISPVETRVGAQKTKFSLSQAFPWFGTLKAQGNTASILAEAKFQEFIEARNKLYFQVASAYYPLYELQEWLQIEQENITILNSYKKIANQKFKNGKGAMVDVLRTDIMLKDAETSLEILRLKEKPLRITFNKLLNRQEDEKILINDSLQLDIFSINYKKDSIFNNPKLKALELKQQANKSAEIAIQKQRMPKIGVGLDYVVINERPDVSIDDNGKDVIMPMVSVSIPIFSKKYNAATKEAQLLQESYKFQKQDVVNSLNADYEMAVFQLQEQEKLINLYTDQLQTVQQSLRLLLTSYGNSGKEFEEVLRMQQESLQYQKMIATAMKAYHIAMAKVNYLISKSY